MTRLETIPAALTWIVNRPPGERTRHFGHVFLRVAAIDAQRVQLHQLAAVVFVQSTRARLGRLIRRAGIAGEQRRDRVRAARRSA